ncbi:MAG: hypothetical protein ACE5FS_02730 [Paracoccaceae bacterium]
MRHARIVGFVRDRSAASSAEYVFLTCGIAALAALLISIGGNLTAERARVIERLMLAPDVGGTLEFREK